ncbi:CcmD family protein [Lewinella sp. IMCC34191]|uniref:CcmD family protein n=1 Tax=Lewinella sp. IMCC34191 TaxID=2259172 RepID=UPI001E2C8264|nr:CcmD family protein [Lewinella sp. IMCC34191]
MMYRNSRILALLALIVHWGGLFAQSGTEPAPDFLRSIGKMYVVVAVIVVVFLGLAFYLWRLDRRLTDIENQIEDHA